MSSLSGASYHSRDAIADTPLPDFYEPSRSSVCNAVNCNNHCYLCIALDVLCCQATVMITPTAQSNRSALKPGNPCADDDSACCHGHRAVRMLIEVLPTITRLLTMAEVLVLGQVCRDLRCNLEVSGVITDIRRYLSLPKNKQRAIHRLQQVISKTAQPSHLYQICQSLSGAPDQGIRCQPRVKWLYR